MWSGREGGRQTKNLVLAIFLKSVFKLLQLLHSFMLGLVMSKQFKCGTYSVICL